MRTMLSMVPLSNEEVFARAAQRKQEEEALLTSTSSTAASLYDTELLQRMQFVLTLLDRRAMQGPHSIEMQEVEEMNTHLQCILEEMKSNQHLQPQRPSPSSFTSSPPPPLPRTGQDNTAKENGPYTDTHTTNTYIIPNMDEMTPDEYQAQLQQTVIDHQTMRRNTGVTGNRATWNYMQHLNPNDTGPLHKNMYNNNNSNNNNDESTTSNNEK
jgi:hypothetical protein